MFLEMRDAWQKHGVVDVALLSASEFRVDYMRAADLVPAPSRYKQYVSEMKEECAKMRAAEIGDQLASHKIDSIGEAIEELSKLDGRTQDTQKDFSMVQMAVDFATRMHQGKPEFFKCGLGLDSTLRLKRGHMLVVGARPSVGKTAFALQIALNLAMKDKHVVFFSHETDKETIFDRLFANISQIDSAKVQECEVSYDNDFVAAELDWMAKLPITVVEAAGRTVSWIGGEALRLKADVVIVDYLGLVHSSAKTRYEKATEISLDFHTFAQRNKILTILLSQLNRAGANMPLMESLRESGQIEQDVDAIILLEAGDKRTEDESGSDLTAVLAKNKNGHCGAVPLAFEKRTQRITAVEVPRYEPTKKRR